MSWRKNEKKKKTSRNKILDAKRLLFATIYQIGSQKSQAQGIFWPPSEQQTHFRS